MQDLQVQLRLALERDEPHGWSCRGFGNRLRIAVIGLLRLDVGLDVLGRHQPDRVALCSERATEEVRAAARFHRDDAGRQARREGNHSLARHAAPKHDGPI
jgi:hypothetical protein